MTKGAELRKEVIPLDHDCMRMFNRVYGAEQIVSALEAIPNSAQFMGFGYSLAKAREIKESLVADFKMYAMKSASRAGLPVHAIKTMAPSEDLKHMVFEIEDQGELL